MKRLVSALAIVVLSVGAVATARPAAAQIPDFIPDPPPPPPQLEPVTQIVAPISFHACQAPSTLQTLATAASGIAGVPIPVAIGPTVSPILDLLLFDFTCAYFRPKIVPPRCAIDDTIYGIGGVSAVNTPLPASILATEVVAIERTLNALGAPAGNQISNEVWFQLGCED